MNPSCRCTKQDEETPNTHIKSNSNAHHGQEHSKLQHQTSNTKSSGPLSPIAFSSVVGSLSPSLASPASLSAFPPMAPRTSFTSEAGPPPAGSLPLPEHSGRASRWAHAHSGGGPCACVCVCAYTPPHPYPYPRPCQPPSRSPSRVAFAFAEIAPLVADLTISRACACA